MSAVRTPSGVAVELRLLAGSLKGIAGDIDRGLREHPDEFEQGFADHVTNRLGNVESLLADIRHGVVLAPRGLPWPPSSRSAA